ncbi:hypothetical protein I6N96_08565 [Enterococcus sp. BWM-S5]|uniref:Uncharacterized protein n=1 Tax=Enterococcus larvae TaxID=2794352 RepID=A0ABS4CI80_9ENTE|nr:hypothetical protein [Enterococcus larvae]MBP1046336.1 hypothetical protein [Enterococcus larvae]
MEETIFFNLGNAIAASKDEKELMRMAQIEHDNRKLKGHLIVVEDPENGEHLLFDISDVKEGSEDGTAYIVKKSFDTEK